MDDLLGDMENKAVTATHTCEEKFGGYLQLHSL